MQMAIDDVLCTCDKNTGGQVNRNGLLMLEEGCACQTVAADLRDASH
jgi:hypothetical protein